VIDDVTKECLAAVADTSISGRRVVRELNAVIAWRGRPDLIVSDHGTEFTSNAMLAWTQERRIAWHFIAPDKPIQNGICEAFNGECATDCSTRRSSTTSGMPDRRWPGGPPATTKRGADPGRCRANLRRNGAIGSATLTSFADRRCSAGAPAPISTPDSGSKWMNVRGHSRPSLKR
jgi:transposase InsO family protein